MGLSKEQRGKIAVCVPVYKDVEPECEAGLRALEEMGYPVWRARGYSAIDHARNCLATRCLDAGCDGIMWIDSDIGFAAEDVDKLIDQGVDAVCGLYVRRDLAGLCALPLAGDVLEAWPFGPDGWSGEIRAAGMGFFFVSASALHKVHAAMGMMRCQISPERTVIPFFLPMVVRSEVNSQYLCEDYAFCQRLRLANVPIYADTTVRLIHVGRIALQVCDLTRGKMGGGVAALVPTPGDVPSVDTAEIDSQANAVDGPPWDR